MATATVSSPPALSMSLAKRAAQAFGVVILSAIAWQAVVLLAAAFRYYRSPSFWLEVGVNLPLCIPCWLGGVALLRGRPSGFRFLYLALVLLVVAGSVVFFGPLRRLLGLPRFGRMPSDWPIVVGVLAFLVIAHQLIRRVSGPEATVAGHPRRTWACLLLALCLVYFGCCYGRQFVEEEARELVERGIIAYEEGRPDDALKEWSRVINRYPCTSAWGVAVFNTGVWHREQGDLHEAVKHFESLLKSGVNDCDPSGHLMESYQNYRHRACLELSGCHESLGDLQSALRYAVLARDRYPYQSWCGNCLGQAGKALEERIKRLEQRRTEVEGTAARRL